MATKYKVGDKVILGEHFNRRAFGPAMDQYVGKKATLVRSSTIGSEPSWYVDIDGGAHYWYEDSFLDVRAK